MYEIADIVKAYSYYRHEKFHYLILDNTNRAKYAAICLENGMYCTILKHRIDTYGTKVA